MVFGLRFAATTVVHYLRPDTVRFERLLPIVRYGPLATDRGSYPMETITPSASLTNAATVLLLAALVGVVVLLRRRGWAWLGLTAGAALARLDAGNQDRWHDAVRADWKALLPNMGGVHTWKKYEGGVCRTV